MPLTTPKVGFIFLIVVGYGRIILYPYFYDAEQGLDVLQFGEESQDSTVQDEDLVNDRVTLETSIHLPLQRLPRIGHTTNQLELEEIEGEIVGIHQS